MNEHVQVHRNHQELGKEAADRAEELIQQAVESKGRCSLVLASAPSQDPVLTSLAERTELPWHAVTLLHLDEYVGLPAQAPQLFSRWLETKLGHLPYKAFHVIDSQAEDPVAEAARYARLLDDVAPADVVLMGVGVNGHLAFNEPGDADLDTPERVRVVDLTDESRQQQVDEGLFETFDDVPRQAISLTVPALLNSTACVMSALGAAKANAVNAMLSGPISPECPASAIRTHDDVRVFLDEAAASVWTGTN